MDQQLAMKLEQSHFRLTDAAHHKEESDVWRTDRHKHEGIELLYLLVKGGASIEAEDQQIGVSVCDVVAYPANVYHEEKMDRSRSQEFYCLMLETDFILPELLRISDRDGRLRWLFSNIHSEYHDEHRSDLLLSHYIKALLLNLLKMDEGKPTVGELIEQYIKTNYKERITVRDVAQMAHVSESYAYRVLKRGTGLSPIQFINHLRLEEAKRLLVTTNKTVETISHEVGFSSQKYFSRMFKERCGSTPSAFRKAK